MFLLLLIQRKTAFALLLSLLSLYVLYSSPAYSWDRPFDRSANWGGTGLLEMPNARILDDGVIRAGVAQALPYRWFTAGMGIFPGLEFTGRFTAITNIPSGMPGYGSNKDKAFDVKYQLLPESRWLPALAMGWNDFTGTGLFESKYVALNRQIFPFDFTIGYGTRRFKGPFAGIEVAVHPRLHFLAEYSPIDYEEDSRSARGVPEGAEWPLNFGVKCKVLPAVDLGVSYQRGDTLGLSLSLQTELGNPVLPQRAAPAPLADVDRRPFRERDKKEMVEKIHTAVKQAGFSNVSVYTDGETLTAEFTNAAYLSNEKAVGRVLRLLLLHAPSDAKKLQAIIRQQGIPILTVSVKPDILESYLFGDLKEDLFAKLIDIRFADKGLNKEDQSIVYAGGEETRYSYGVKPDLEFFLNDPSGFFKFRLGVKPWGVLDLWPGGEAYARLNLPFYSNITSSNVVRTDTVREDSWKYLGDNWSFNALMFNQTLKLTERTFGRLSFGYLEYMYAGGSGEILHFLGDGNIALGIQGDWARKREPETQFALYDHEYYDILANAYFRIPSLAVTLQTQYGRFMAGDVGWLFTGSREYDTGVIIGAWYSFTDSEKLSGFSQGYDSQGVFISIPERILLTRDSPRRYSYSLAPWSRDVAATVYHWQSVFDVVGEIVPGRFKGKLGDIKQ